MSARHTFAISPEVRAVLERCEIGEDRVTLPPEQLDRTLYQGVIKVLGEYGAKWSRSAKAILFPPAARPKLLEALGRGEVKRERVIRQAFYTPDAVASRLVRFAAEIYEGNDPIRELRVLEPSAGGGALIAAARRYYRIALEVHAVEIDEAAAEVLREETPAAHVTCADFLTLPPSPLFDIVLMNPPYQRGQAKKHVAHALRFVAPGGVLASVVPRNFPEIIGNARFEELDVEAGAFAESGTGVATKLIRWRRSS